MRLLAMVYLALLVSYDGLTQGASSLHWSNEDRTSILLELDRTTSELRQEIQDLTQAQWDFQEDPTRWSIGEIVEHLEMQNQLHYREIYAVANAPEMPKYRQLTQGADAHFIKYATDAEPGQAQWFLKPLGRFPTKAQGLTAFLKARGELRSWVATTDRDLRQQFTFRNNGGKKSLEDLKIGEVRDLHQLLLTGVAHTDRHLLQIRKIKSHPLYPNSKP